MRKEENQIENHTENASLRIFKIMPRNLQWYCMFMNSDSVLYIKISVFLNYQFDYIMQRILSSFRCVFRQIYSTYWLLRITLSDYSFALCSFFKIWSHGNYIHKAPTATRPLFFRVEESQLSNHKNKFKSLADFTPSLSAWRFSIRKDYWARTFKCLWGPGIDSKEWIPPAYVVWRAGTITLFLLGA